MSAIRVKLSSGRGCEVGTPSEAEVLLTPAVKPLFLLSYPQAKIKPGDTVPVSVTCLNPDLLTEDAALTLRYGNTIFGSGTLPAGASSVQMNVSIPADGLPCQAYLLDLFNGSADTDADCYITIADGYVCLDNLSCLGVGQSVQYFAAEDWAKRYWSFTSSDESVLTIDENGVITGVSAGFAEITLLRGGNTHNGYYITVVEPDAALPVLNLEATGDATFGEEYAVRLTSPDTFPEDMWERVCFIVTFLGEQGETLYTGVTNRAVATSDLRNGISLIDRFWYANASAKGTIASLRILMCYNSDAPGYRIGTGSVTVPVAPYDDAVSGDLVVAWYGDGSTRRFYCSLWAYNLISGDVQAQVKLEGDVLFETTLNAAAPTQNFTKDITPALYGTHVYELYLDGALAASRSLEIEAPFIEIVPDSVLLNIGAETAIGVAGIFGALEITGAPDSSVATARLDDRTLIITGVGAGETTVTLTSNFGNTATLRIAVYDPDNPNNIDTPKVKITPVTDSVALGEQAMFYVEIADPLHLVNDNGSFHVMQQSYAVVDGEEVLISRGGLYFNVGENRTKTGWGLTMDEYGRYIEGHTVSAIRVRLSSGSGYEVGAPSEAEVSLTPAVKPLFTLSRAGGDVKPGDTVPVTVKCLNPDLITEDLALSLRNNSDVFGSVTFPAGASSAQLNVLFSSNVLPLQGYTLYLHTGEIKEKCFIYFHVSGGYSLASIDYLDEGQNERYITVEDWAKSYWSFKSGDESILTIDENGVVTGVSAGVTTVIRQLNGDFFSSGEMTVLAPDDTLPVVSLAPTGNASFNDSYETIITASEGASGSNWSFRLRTAFLDAQGNELYATEDMRDATLDDIAAGNARLWILSDIDYARASAKGVIYSLRVRLCYGNTLPGYRIEADTITVPVSPYDTAPSFEMPLGTFQYGEKGISGQIYAFNLTEETEAQLRLDGGEVLGTVVFTPDSPVQSVMIHATERMLGEHIYGLYVDNALVASVSRYIDPRPIYFDSDEACVSVAGEYSIGVYGYRDGLTVLTAPDASVATAELNDFSVTLTGVAAGETTMTVQNPDGDTATLKISVYDPDNPDNVATPTITITADKPSFALGEDVTFTVSMEEEAYRVGRNIGVDCNIYATVNGEEISIVNMWPNIYADEGREKARLIVSYNFYGAYLNDGGSVTALRVELRANDGYIVGTPGEASVTFTALERPLFTLSRPNPLAKPGVTMPVTVTCLSPELLTEDAALSLRCDGAVLGAGAFPAGASSAEIGVILPADAQPSSEYTLYLYDGETKIFPLLSICAFPAAFNISRLHYICASARAYST